MSAHLPAIAAFLPSLRIHHHFLWLIVAVVAVVIWVLWVLLDLSDLFVRSGKPRRRR